MMTLGVFYHSALIYATEGYWRITSPNNSIVFSWFADVVHAFRMTAFYIVAGFFIAMASSKYPMRHVVKDRLFRLGVPMITIGFTLNYAMNFFSSNRVYDFSSISYIINGDWLGHLWFVGNLIVYVIMYFACQKYIAKIRLDGLKSTYLLLLMVLISTVLSVFFIGIFHYIGKTVLVFISVGPLLSYFCYFVLGVVFFNNKNFFLSLSNDKLFSLQTRFFLVLLFVLVISEWFGTNSLFLKILWIFAGSFLSIYVLSVFNRYAIDSSINRAISNCSYTIYLLHQPLIILMYPIISYFNFDLWVSYMLLTLLVLLSSYLVHSIFVKKSRLFMFLINGVPYSRKYKIFGAGK